MSKFIDFSEYDTLDLELALHLYKELRNIHLEGLSEDGIAELEDELEERRFKTDFDIEEYLLEEGLERWREKREMIT